MTTEDKAKAAAEQSLKEKNQQRSWPKNPGAVFESWLKKQQKRDDETGQVARWVRRKMDEREWMTSESQKTTQGATRNLPSDERLLAAWRQHLRAHHGVSPGGIQVFEQVFDEYRQARARYQEEVRQTIGS